MSAAGTPARAYLSIGEVLGELRPEFPDVTISKIRFLEAEGLVQPDRTPSGYRKFSRVDVARLRYVLTQQRDHYLPLRVIKENLDALDRGVRPPVRPGEEAPPRHLVPTTQLPEAEDFLPEPRQMRLTRDELLRESGMSGEQLQQLEQYGLIQRRGKTSFYDADAAVIAQVVLEMARFGIEPRHLRPYRSAADREIGLFQQVVAPMARHRGPEAQDRAEEAVRELAALSVRLHAALVRAGLQAELGR